MSKKINLAYEWIGPNGPLTNNRMPTITDLMTASVDYHFPQLKGDLFQKPHFHSRIVNSRIVPTYKLPNETFLYELNWTNFHYRDKLHNFYSADGLFDDNQIAAEVLHRVRNKTAYLLVTLFYEGYMDDEFLNHLSDYFTSKGLPLTQIIYMTNCYNGQEVYEDYCKRNHKLPEMQMEYFPVFRIDKCNVRQAMTESVISKYRPGPRKKTFLCFNRRYNDHRLMLYLAVVQQGLIDQCYYSMDKTQPEANRSFIENCKYLLSRFSDMGLVSDDVLAADKLLPLVLDNPNFSRYPMEHSVDPVKHLYDTSLINIVTETYFFNKIIHITEKTYKPIAFMQPFILVAAAGSLQHLKDMGFKTFGNFWDESYDQELDDKQRFRKITALIQSIADWTEEEKTEFTFKVKDIVDYNAAHLNTMQDIEIDNLVEKYGT
jgi:hypothetical protein